jgi:hypothetical protein
MSRFLRDFLIPLLLGPFLTFFKVLQGDLNMFYAFSACLKQLFCGVISAVVKVNLLTENIVLPLKLCDSKV